MKIEDIAKIIPDRIRDSHKGTYGKVALLGGAVEYSGAIKLSAMALAALKSGAGLSTVAIPRYLVPIVSANILEVMIYPIDSTDDEIIFNKENIEGLLDKVDVLTCGMGLGKSNGAYEIIYYIIRNFNGKLVLDADALNILSENVNILNESKCKIILTPHMMEFKRLYDASFGGDFFVDSSLDDRIKAAKEFAEKNNIILLLKGPTTIVVSQNRMQFVDRGTPGMATAGSGDVLSGIITGFLGYIDDEFDASVAAAYVNGAAGELAARDVGEISMTSGDTIKHISEAIKTIKG